MKLESFAFIGIKNLVIKERDTHTTKCLLPHLVNLSLNDETARDYLRGGLGNPKLLTVFGDRDTTLTGTTATMTADLMSVMTSNDVETVTKAVQVVETLEADSANSGTFTLTQAPSATNTAITVWSVDDVGKSEALTKGDAVSDGVYTVTGQAIETETTVTRIKVAYMVDKEVQGIAGKDFVAKTYEANGILLVQEIESDKIFTVDLELPRITVAPSYSLSAKNESGAPDTVELTIDLLKDDNKGYSYYLAFYEE